MGRIAGLLAEALVLRADDLQVNFNLLVLISQLISKKRSTSEHPKLLPSSQERGTQWHGVILYPKLRSPGEKTSVTLGS